MATLIENGYKIFTDKEGNPIEEGYIFIGEAGLNPISNPQTAYWDADLTIPATNIRTAGGYAMYNGSPGRLYVSDNYSILVQNKQLQTVYVQLNAEGYVDTPSTVPGFDNSYVEIAGAATITVKTGSTADVNGVSAEVVSDMFLTLSLDDTEYYIRLTSTGIASLSTDPGTFDVDLNARYFAGDRILNWIVKLGDGNIYLTKIYEVYSFRATFYPENLKRVTFVDDVNSLTLKLLYTAWSQDKNSLAIAGTGSYPSITALDSTHVAFADSGIVELRTYLWDGTSWSLEGSGLSLSTIGILDITALDSTHVALVDGSANTLQTYVWNGSTWGTEGSALSLSTVGDYVGLTALDSTHIAFINNTSSAIQTYVWNGSTWSADGSALSIVGGGAPAITALDSTHVAYLDATIEELRTYLWDGSSWSLEGSGLSIAGITTLDITALDSTHIAFVDNTLKTITTYVWDGASWSTEGSGLTISNASVPSLTTLDSIHIVFIENVSKALTTYKNNRFLGAIDVN